MSNQNIAFTERPNARTYTDVVAEEMAFVYLFDMKASLVTIARLNKVFYTNGKPNNSAVRQRIHKYLKKANPKAWTAVDCEEAEADRVAPRRSALADRIVAFFPDTERYKELIVRAAELKVERLKYERKKQTEKSFIYNDDLNSALEDLRNCQNGLTDDDVIK